MTRPHCVTQSLRWGTSGLLLLLAVGVGPLGALGYWCLCSRPLLFLSVCAPQGSCGVTGSLNFPRPTEPSSTATAPSCAPTSSAYVTVAFQAVRADGGLATPLSRGEVWTVVGLPSEGVWRVGEGGGRHRGQAGTVSVR